MTNFKVLSLDGGGIRGLFTARLLHEFEASIRGRDGDEARLVDRVDLLCGTSTGGLIALALAMRVPTERICRFYEVGGPEIFRRSQNGLSLVRQMVAGGKYSDKKLRALLEDMFEGKTVGDSDALLCIPTFDFTHGTYEIFKFDHPEGNLTRHNRIPAVDVALATSAAPTYFPVAQVDALEDTQFVDGGVWANNPALVGMAESLWHFAGVGKRYSGTQLLSVSCLNTTLGHPPLGSRRRSILRWAPDLFEMGLNAQSEFTHIFLEMLAKTGQVPLEYTRVIGPPVSASQAKLLRLDLASAPALALMNQLAADAFHALKSNDAVQRFFSTEKSYFTK